MGRQSIRGGVGIIASLFILSACSSTATRPEQIRPNIEADWIREGQPLEFEGELWVPQDNIENLLDSEVFRIGTYKSVDFFVDRVDVRPYNRIYTRFSRNHYRLFEKQDDHNHRSL